MLRKWREASDQRRRKRCDPTQALYWQGSSFPSLAFRKQKMLHWTRRSGWSAQPPSTLIPVLKAAAFCSGLLLCHGQDEKWPPHRGTTSELQLSILAVLPMLRCCQQRLARLVIPSAVSNPSVLLGLVVQLRKTGGCLEPAEGDIHFQARTSSLQRRLRRKA